MKTNNTLPIILLTSLVGWTGVAQSRGPLLFGTPQNLGSSAVGEVNTTRDDDGPRVSSDGLTLIFDSGGLGGEGGHDLWMATRATLGEPFCNPENLGPQVNSPANEYSPDLSADGLTLIFDSNRAGGLGHLDIWLSARASVNDPWTEVMNVGPPINSRYNECFSCLSADRLELYFSDTPTSDLVRPGGRGASDIWVSKRSSAGEPWGEPVNLGAPVNSGSYEAGPSLSLVETASEVEGPWTPLDAARQVLNHHHNVSLSADGATRFFRLAGPQ